MSADDHTPEQIASAYATLDLALAHPDHLDMRMWVSASDEWDLAIDLDDLIREADSCGTTACFAGWHVARMGYRVDSNASVYDQDGYRIGSADGITSNDLGITGEVRDDLFLRTSTEGLPYAIAIEFGPRPAAAAKGDIHA
jgi:hypothetical protein